MSDILSQDEVDSLLDGMNKGAVASETDVPSYDEDSAVKYDFYSQDRVIRGRMPTFEVVIERFAREVRTSLTSLLRTNIDIAAGALDTLKFSDFGRSLPVPTSLHMFRMDPFRGHALLVLESRLVFNLIDTFFGGKGTGTARIEGRDFTSIEEVMVKKVVEACLKNLETAWEPVEEITTVLVRSEVNPQFATIVQPSDLVIVTKFEVELEQSAGTLTLCIPYAMIEPIRNKLSAGFQAETLDIDYAWQNRLKDIIKESEVDISVLIGSTQITGESLINMKTGDVIQLDQDIDKPLVATIEGTPKMLGTAGVQRGLQSFKLNKKIIVE